MTDALSRAPIPQGWKAAPLWSFFRRLKRTGYEDEELLSVYRDYGVIPRASRDDNFNKASEDLGSYQLVEPGDLVVNKMKAWQGSLGVSPHRGIVSPAYFVYALQRQVDTRFIHYLLRSQQYASWYRAISKGIRPNQWDLIPEDFGRVPVLTPPLPEQRAIADFLDRETAQIDAMVDAQERLVALLEERRSAVVTAAVTEGIERAPLVETGNRWMPAIPQGWNLVQFRRVVKVVNGLVDPTEPPYADMVLVAPNHVEKGTGRVLALETAADQHAESGKYIVRAGQIIYSKIRPALNKVALATQDCLCSADMYALDSDPRQMTNRFLAYYLRARPFHAFASEMSMRVAMPKVNRDEIASGPIAVPPLAEQGEIVEHLDYATGRIDRAISKARRSIALMKERRAAVISAAVTGRIDVRTGIEQVERDLEEARV